MVEEKIYKLKNGINMILIEHAIYKDKRYLLLNKENTDEVTIAYEENGELINIDEKYPEYHQIALSLLTKLERK